MRLLPLLVVSCFLTACATSPSYDEQVWETYRVGMTRAEVHELLTRAKLIINVPRPESGWSDEGDEDFGAARTARDFERAHPGVMVATCEVFWVDRHTSIPLAPGGVWFDYLLSDGEDRLLGYQRVFVD